MRPLLITCSVTGRKVQVLVPDTPETTLQSVNCPACKGVHLVHPQTGKSAPADG